MSSGVDSETKIFGNPRRLLFELMHCLGGVHAKKGLTCVDGGVQFPQACSHLSIHLPLPLRLLRERVSVCPKSLTDLHNQDWHSDQVYRRLYTQSLHNSQFASLPESNMCNPQNVGSLPATENFKTHTENCCTLNILNSSHCRKSVRHIAR